MRKPALSMSCRVITLYEYEHYYIAMGTNMV